MAVLEITWNEERQQWHPHLHALIRATFMPQKLLSEQWYALTKGSKVIDIRAIKGSTKASVYLSSYLAKPPTDLSKLPPGKELEWVDANLKGHWLIQWGRALPPDQDMLSDELPNDWERLGTLGKVLEELEDWSTFYQLGREKLLEMIKGQWEDERQQLANLQNMRPSG